MSIRELLPMRRSYRFPGAYFSLTGAMTTRELEAMAAALDCPENPIYAEGRRILREVLRGKGDA